MTLQVHEKEQMNVLVARDAKKMAKLCAVARRESLNAWVEEAIREKAVKDYGTFEIEKLDKALTLVARRYLPGRVRSSEEMMALAMAAGPEDDVDGFDVEYYTAKPLRSVKPRSRSRRS